MSTNNKLACDAEEEDDLKLNNNSHTLSQSDRYDAATSRRLFQSPINCGIIILVSRERDPHDLRACHPQWPRKTWRKKNTPHRLVGIKGDTHCLCSQASRLINELFTTNRSDRLLSGSGGRKTNLSRVAF